MDRGYVTQLQSTYFDTWSCSCKHAVVHVPGLHIFGRYGYLAGGRERDITNKYSQVFPVDPALLGS